MIFLKEFMTVLTHITLIVADQDKALDFYINKFGFRLHTDVFFDEFRWLTVCPRDNEQFEIALVPARSTEEEMVIGKQAGNYPLFSLSTDDCKKMYQELEARGVEFTQKPTEKPWGIDALCKDLYGNSIHINQAL